jgi:hypothetical protein
MPALMRHQTTVSMEAESCRAVNTGDRTGYATLKPAFSIY